MESTNCETNGNRETASRLIGFSWVPVLITIGVLVTMPFIGPIPARADDFAEIEKALDTTGQVQEGALVIRFPRSDIKVAIDGDSVPTSLGFTSWTAWKNMGESTMVMGDLVLLEKEVAPVISALQEANINITALHNHFIGDQPHIMFMHIDAVGKGTALARGLKNALAKTATPVLTGSSNSALALDTRRIEEIIGYSGSSAGGSFRITVGRPGVRSRGMDLTSSMGMNSWAAFVGTNERAHVAGDVAMTATEVNRVIRVLTRGGIEVVAVHNHMLDEEPRIFFLHYWGTGPVEKLAQTVRAALDEVQGPVQ